MARPGKRTRKPGNASSNSATPSLMPNTTSQPGASGTSSDASTIMARHNVQMQAPNQSASADRFNTTPASATGLLESDTPAQPSEDDSSRALVIQKLTEDLSLNEALIAQYKSDMTMKDNHIKLLKSQLAAIKAENDDAAADCRTADQALENSSNLLSNMTNQHEDEKAEWEKERRELKARNDRMLREQGELLFKLQSSDWEHRKLREKLERESNEKVERRWIEGDDHFREGLALAEEGKAMKKELLRKIEVVNEEGRAQVEKLKRSWDAKIQETEIEKKKAIAEACESKRKQQSYDSRSQRLDYDEKDFESRADAQQAKLDKQREELKSGEDALAAEKRDWNAIWAKRQANWILERDAAFEGLAEEQYNATEATRILDLERAKWQEEISAKQKVIDDFPAADKRREELIARKDEIITLSKQISRQRHDVRAWETKIESKEKRIQKRLDKASKLKLDAEKQKKTADKREQHLSDLATRLHNQKTAVDATRDENVGVLKAIEQAAEQQKREKEARRKAIVARIEQKARDDSEHYKLLREYLSEE